MECLACGWAPESDEQAPRGCNRHCEVPRACQHFLGTVVYTPISPSAQQLQVEWDFFGKMKDWGAI